MSAVIIDLATARAARQASFVPLFAPPQNAPWTKNTAARSEMADTLLPYAVLPRNSFQFWTGASGTRYVHTIYNLFECPPVDHANYILVKRHSNGQRTVISIGRAGQASGTLNLAEIRLRSAQLGANEVHVHFLADSIGESCQIEADLRRSLVVA